MIRTIFLTALGLSLAGCSSMGLERFGGSNRAASLPPAPTAPVQSQGLEPLVIQPQGAAQVVGVNPQATGQQPFNNAMGAEAELPNMPGQVAAIPSSAKVLSRTDLLGAWTLASGAEQCKLNINLTTWTGGYRASSRGCQSPDLQRINAWTLAGKQVVLLAEDGQTIVARLHSTSAGRFDGQAQQDGRAVSFFR